MEKKRSVGAIVTVALSLLIFASGSEIQGQQSGNNKQVKLPATSEVEKYEFCFQENQQKWFPLSKEDGDAVLNLVTDLRGWGTEIAKQGFGEPIIPPFSYHIRLITHVGKAINLGFCAGDSNLWIEDKLFCFPKENGVKIREIVEKNAKQNYDTTSSAPNSQEDFAHQKDFIHKEVNPRQFDVAVYYKEFVVPKSMFKVDFQGGFNNERVVLYADDKQVFSRTITSEWSNSFAGSIELKKRADIVNLKVVLPKKREVWHCAIDLSKGSYIGIELAKEQIGVIQSRNPFVYD